MLWIVLAFMSHVLIAMGGVLGGKSHRLTSKAHSVATQELYIRLERICLALDDLMICPCRVHSRVSTSCLTAVGIRCFAEHRK